MAGISNGTNGNGITIKLGFREMGTIVFWALSVWGGSFLIGGGNIQTRRVIIAETDTLRQQNTQLQNLINYRIATVERVSNENRHAIETTTEETNRRIDSLSGLIRIVARNLENRMDTLEDTLKTHYGDHAHPKP